MTATPINAPDAPAPVGAYCQAVDVRGATRLLVVSGQVPESVDGYVPTGFEAQCRLAWSNLVAQLRAGGMTVDDLVKVTVYLASRSHSRVNSEVRREVLGDRPTALTVVVAGILHEEWLLEIEALAVA